MSNEIFYTDEHNMQILLALLKEHKIKKVVTSPGATNSAFVSSMQQDAFFELYSCVDERSAAYMACGLATESNEAVVLSCTGATASRNYLPGLTEAFYRKLPILAITSSQPIARIGHHSAQLIDRSNIPNDVARVSVTLPIIKDDADIWECEIKVNQAILELFRHGGGPVHINLPVANNKSNTTKELPKVRVINRIAINNQFPELPKGKIGVFVGSHATWTEQQTEVLDKFCEANNAVVFCDHTSGYKGKYRLLFSILGFQQHEDMNLYTPDLFIHIGEITGDYTNICNLSSEIWRVNEDGEIRDTFGKLRYVFEMSESNFFRYYTNEKKVESTYLKSFQTKLNEIRSRFPDIPFSNIWVASKIAHRIPQNSVIYLSILNSLRSWNLFEIPSTVLSSSNVGGFGIDGGLSSLIGSSFVNKNKLYFCVIGDLAFFYDMNVLGNRHIGNNVRILLINNGKGTEFRNFNHLAARFGEMADEHIAAAGHFGNKSKTLVKNYVENLNFEYLSASTKEEFENVMEDFLIDKITNKSMLLEVFTNSDDESDALKTITKISKIDSTSNATNSELLLKKGKKFLKKFL